MNHGEICEVFCKAALGYKPVKDANTRHDKGHDIEEINASVKSHSCGLTDRKDLRAICNNKEEFITKFFEEEQKDTIYIYVCEKDGFVTLWFMNREEFITFTENFGSYDKHDKKIRFKKADSTINKYCEKMLNAA